MILAVILLCLTIVIEAGVLAALGYRSSRDVICVVGINCMTHPALSFVLMYHHVLGYVGSYVLLVFVLEVIVVLFEALLWRYVCQWSIAWSLGLSLCMNGASYACGVLLFLR